MRTTRASSPFVPVRYSPASARLISLKQSTTDGYFLRGQHPAESGGRGLPRDGRVNLARSHGLIGAGTAVLQATLLSRIIDGLRYCSSNSVADADVIVCREAVCTQNTLC